MVRRSPQHFGLATDPFLTVLSDVVGLTLSRQLLQSFAELVSKHSSAFIKSTISYTLEKVQSKAVSYEEQTACLREVLASVHEAEEDWLLAAQTLAGIDLDSSVRKISPNYKLEKCIKIAMLYLEGDDAVNAETYTKKASGLLSACHDEDLELQYKSCHARILDSKRRFLDASQKYYELSQLGNKTVGKRKVDERELEQALDAAVTCAILGPAGPLRSRILATLYKDDRTSGMRVGTLLEKVYLERLLDKQEIESFAAGLAPHQLALLPDGSTVLERSVTEHNLEAASKLYMSISISELSALLNVTHEQAEGIASKMANEGRLRAMIDQLEDMIIFSDAPTPLEAWDSNISTICYAVNNALEKAAATLKGVEITLME